LVPSCPETSLGTSRSPLRRARMNRPGCACGWPARRWAGPARAESTSSGLHVAHRSRAPTWRRPRAASAPAATGPPRPRLPWPPARARRSRRAGRDRGRGDPPGSARRHDHGTGLAPAAPDHPVAGFWRSSWGVAT